MKIQLRILEFPKSRISYKNTARNSRINNLEFPKNSISVFLSAGSAFFASHPLVAVQPLGGTF